MFQKQFFAILLSGFLFSCAQPALQNAAPNTGEKVQNENVDTAGGNAFSENPERWKLLSDSNGLRVYQDLEAIPGRVGLRGKITVSASIAKVATALTELEIRKKWMNIIVEERIVRDLSDFERIEYERLQSNWPYQYIDFVYKTTYSVLRKPPTLLIRMASVNTDSVPVPTDTVRGQMTGSYDFVKTIDADHSEIVLEMGIDPKGALPSWDSQTKVVAWFNQTLLALKNTVEDPKLKVSTRVQNYITKYHL